MADTKDVTKNAIKELVDILNKHTEAYDAGHPTISDEDWDKMYFELEALEKIYGIIFPDSPTQKIHYKEVSSLEKIKHEHPLLSLAKTKDWNEFINYFEPKSVIGMLKLDGLTCSLTYENGRLMRAETRGDGVIGENILHNAQVIKSIPKRIKYRDRLVVDGEVICAAEDFKQFANEYANPRNFASGSIRLLDSKECEKRNLTFVVWNVAEGFNELNSFIDKLERVEELGFLTVPWVSSFDLDAKEFLIERAELYGYPIDGLVGRFDDISYGESLGVTGHHSKAAFAFKFYDETYPTKLIDIEWSLGRSNVLTPVAVFEPVIINSNIITRASLHNLSVMKNILGENPYVGQKINVFLSNMIIPQIKSINEY